MHASPDQLGRGTSGIDCRVRAASVSLAGKLHELHASLASDPNYLMRAAPPADRLGAAGGAGGGGGSGGFGAMEEDAVMVGMGGPLGK